jgi:hypothetical protein
MNIIKKSKINEMELITGSRRYVILKLPNKSDILNVGIVAAIGLGGVVLVLSGANVLLVGSMVALSLIKSLK